MRYISLLLLLSTTILRTSYNRTQFVCIYALCSIFEMIIGNVARAYYHKRNNRWPCVHESNEAKSSQVGVIAWQHQQPRLQSMKVNVVKCFDCWSHTQHTSSPKDGDMVQREIYVCMSDSMNVAYRYISCLHCVCSFFIFLSDFSFTRWYSVPALSTWARHPKNVNKFSTPLLRTLVLFL